jgi:hypothetical protein
MSKEPEKKKIPSAIQGSGYERGFWLLVGASGFMIALLFAMESSRAKPLGFGFSKKVVVERISLEEARNLGVNSRNN